MASLIRDAPVGQLIRFVTRNRVFQYPEERPDFQVPQHWLDLLNDNNNSDDTTVEEKVVEPRRPTGGVISSSASSAPSIKKDEEQPADTQPYDLGRQTSLAIHRSRSRTETIPYTEERLEADEAHEIERTKSVPIVPKKTKDGAILVDWYFSDDSENPQNWSNRRRGLITFVICLYTFVVYTSSAIYTTSEEGVMKEFGVDETNAALGLSLFVLGYGIGPLLFSPLSEIPRIGRNPIYIVTIFLFVIVSIPAPLVNNFAGLMVLRFLQGLFGSPCLASGAASLGDMYSLLNLPYALIAWGKFLSYCFRGLAGFWANRTQCRRLIVVRLSARFSPASRSPSKDGAGPCSRSSGRPSPSSWSCSSSSPRRASRTSCSAGPSAYGS
jgi:MFS transporter, DHA1 family, multidrug resistance protein